VRAYIRSFFWTAAIVITLGFQFSAQSAFAAPWEKLKDHQAPLTEAETKLANLFSEKKFSQLIQSARLQLRKNPDHPFVWYLLAVSYFHVGDFKQSVTILRSMRKLTKDTSYADLYLGLNYKYLDSIDQSRQFFRRGAENRGEFARHCLLESAILEWEQEQPAQALSKLQDYLRQYPRSRDRRGVQELAKKIEMTKTSNPEDLAKLWKRLAIKPLQDGEEMYRNHPFSMIAKPHMWYARTGTKYGTLETKYPIFDGLTPGKLANLKTTQQALYGDLGFALGPIRVQNSQVTAGYTYQTEWYTTEERINAYSDDYSDLDYFPFRPDLMERRHVLYADLQRVLLKPLHFGLFGRMEFAKIGSRLFPGPEDTQINRALNVEDTFLLVPYLQWSLNKDWTLVPYLYFFKLVNQDEPDFSQKSYSFEETPSFSFGSTLHWQYKPLSYRSSLRLYQNEAVFNDYWLDYKQIGLQWQQAADLKYGFSWQTGLEYSQRNYILDRPQVTGCGASAGTTADGSPIPKNCGRKQNGLAINLALYWHLSQQMRFEGLYRSQQRDNPGQKENDWNYKEYSFGIAIGFPDIDDNLNPVTFLGRSREDLQLD
jgi:hypothetical protein